MKPPLVEIVLRDMGRLQAGDVGDFSLKYPALWRVLRRERWQVQAGTAAIVEGVGYDWRSFETEYKLCDVDLLALSAREVVDAILVARMLALTELLGKIEAFLAATGLDLERTGLVTLRDWWLKENHSVVDAGTTKGELTSVTSVLAFVPWAPPPPALTDEERLERDEPIVAEGKG